MLLMGKSTISMENHHFQLLFVCSPEGNYYYKSIDMGVSENVVYP